MGCGVPNASYDAVNLLFRRAISKPPPRLGEETATSKKKNVENFEFVVGKERVGRFTLSCCRSSSPAGVSVETFAAMHLPRAAARDDVGIDRHGVRRVIGEPAAADRHAFVAHARCFGPLCIFPDERCIRSRSAAGSIATVFISCVFIVCRAPLTRRSMWRRALPTSHTLLFILRTKVIGNNPCLLAHYYGGTNEGMDTDQSRYEGNCL